MTSWLGLSFLVLLSANAVFSNDYKDDVIDKDPYLSKCIISTGTGDLKQDGVKKIHSGPQCLSTIEVLFKVDRQLYLFDALFEQGPNLVTPAKISYKFGLCFDTHIAIDKDSSGRITYSFIHADGTPLVLEKGFGLQMSRNRQDAGQWYVVVGGNEEGEVSTNCKPLENSQADESTPMLVNFKQEILEGVPDLTMVWQVSGSGRKFGAAYATKVKAPIASTTTTTTTTQQASTISSLVPSTSSLPTTVVPSPALVVEEKEETFPWWIIGVAVGVALVLLIILLVVGYLCWRRRREQKPVKPQNETTVASTVQTVKATSQYGPDMVYFGRDAKPTDPNTMTSVAQSPAPN